MNWPSSSLCMWIDWRRVCDSGLSLSGTQKSHQERFWSEYTKNVKRAERGFCEENHQDLTISSISCSQEYPYTKSPYVVGIETINSPDQLLGDSGKSLIGLAWTLSYS